MNDLRLDQINLNLLVALDALLAETSVSRAAARVGVTQPAMSQSLRQLRELLGDPLLVRGGGGMMRTPRAESLSTPLRRTLIELERVLRGETEFDPRTATRRFAIATGDYGALALLPGLLEALSETAPGIDISVRTIEPSLTPRRLATGEIDLVIAGPTTISDRDCVIERLFTDTFACLVRDGHPDVGDALDLDTYVRIPHALISTTGEGTAIVDTALQSLGRARRIALRLPYFLAAPMIVARSNLILTAPAILARQVARPFCLRVLAPPIPLPAFDIAAQWHRRYDADPAHRWLRGAIGQALAALAAA